MKKKQYALCTQELGLISKLLETVYTHETNLSKFLKDIDIYSMNMYWYISDNTVYDKIEISRIPYGYKIYLPISQYSYEQNNRKMLMIFQLMTSFIVSMSIEMFKQKHPIKYALSRFNLYDISNDVLCKENDSIHIEDIFMNLGQIYMLWHHPVTLENYSLSSMDKEHYGIYYDIVRKLIIDFGN